MTLTFSAEWKGGRWDVERVINDLFTYSENRVAQLISGLKVVPWRPSTTEIQAMLDQGDAYLIAHRTGGTADFLNNAWVDKARVQTAGLTASRAISNELMAFVSDMLLAYNDGGQVKRSTPHRSGLSTTFMKVPGEVVGPQLVPEQLRDERLVPVMYEIWTDRPKGLPETRELLGLD